MKITHALIVAIFPLLVVSAEYGFAQSVVFHTDSTVYSPEDPLLVYGTVSENDPLILRLFAPDGTIKGFEQISADIDGIFNHILLTWPEPSTTFPYGTYSIEILSTTNEGILGTIDVRFGPNENDEIVISRDATALVYAPESAAVDSPIRLFVQTTSDGLLIGDDPKDLLSTTHVHLPDGTVDDISTNFISLHKGLYYIDYVPKTLGTYVFHAVMFYEGTVSHGSAATVVLDQDIGGISDQIVALDITISSFSFGPKRTSIVPSIPSFVVLRISIEYVPYGNVVDGSGHVSSMWLNIPSISADICSNPFIVPSGANSRSISGSFSDTVPYTSRGSSGEYTVLSV